MNSSTTMPELLERCAGIDIHKKTAVTCIMTGFGKKMKKEVRIFNTSTPDLRELAQWLQENEITKIVIESTGVYWKPVFNILEGEFDLEIILANAYQVKNVPHRKSDIKDSEWLCYLLKHGFINKSFIPPIDIRNLRELVRLRQKYVGALTTAKNRLIKTFESKNIKISSVLTNVYGVIGFEVIRLIACGEINPEILVQCFTHKVKASKSEIKKALTGTLQAEDITLIKHQLNYIDKHIELIKDLEKDIEILMLKYTKEAALLMEIPGISNKVAQTIIAEAGINMEAFFSASHFASWTGLVPKTNESAGKRKNTSISGGNSYIRKGLVQAAWAATITKDSYWRAEFQRLRMRLGPKVAIIAIARKMAECIYSILKSNEAYQERGTIGVSEQLKKRKINYHQKMLKQLGVPVQIISS